MKMMVACHPSNLRIKAITSDCYILYNKNNDKNALFDEEGICHFFENTDSIKDFMKTVFKIEI